MASLQIFFDKENAGSTVPFKNRAVTNLKVHQENHCPATPRRALGNVNRDLQQSKPTPLSKGQQGHSAKNAFTEKDSCRKPKPRRALSSISENKVKLESRSKISAECPVKRPVSTNVKHLVTDDIERVYKGPPNIEDDYEDILPKKDRVSSYLNKLISWKPSCFKIWQDDGESDSEELLTLEDEEFPKMSSTKELHEEVLYSTDYSPDLITDDIVLPDIDDLFITLSDDLITLSDDTVDE